MKFRIWIKTSSGFDLRTVEIPRPDSDLLTWCHLEYVRNGPDEPTLHDAFCAGIEAERNRGKI